MNIYIYILLFSDSSSDSESDDSEASEHCEFDDDGMDEEMVKEFEMNRSGYETGDVDLDRTFTTNVTSAATVVEDMDLNEKNSTTDGILSAKIASNAEIVSKKMESVFQDLFAAKNEAAYFVDMPRVVVTTEQLKKFRGNICYHILENGDICKEHLTFDADLKGSNLHLRWMCVAGHRGLWLSSEVLTTSHNAVVYANDLLIGACVLLSGNNYQKFPLLCKFLNLAVPSQSTFTRCQWLFYAPVILDAWKGMKEKVLDVLNPYEDICLLGDGRNDSPGFSARYCVYVIIEHVTGVLVDLEVLDRRETGGHSPNMEREGLTRLLLRLMHEIDITEIVTDASSSIIKRIKELQGKYPRLQELQHSLDVWHKAKSLSKMLHKAAKDKEAAALKPWIPSIINHFWYSCQIANGDTEKLKDCWFGVVHHVCGEHTWSGSACLHGPSTSSEPKQVLEKKSKPAEALRAVVFDRKFLTNFEMYTSFRHTGPFAKTKDGKEIFKVKYSKRTKSHHAEPVKVDKEYAYIPHLLAKILQCRKESTASVLTRNIRSERDPKNIAPLIDPMVLPPTKDLLVKEHYSRFAKK
eukprot:gene16102-7456_t